MSEEQTPFEKGLACYLSGGQEWDNPYHPSLEMEAGQEWLGGFRSIPEERDAPTFPEFLYEGDQE